MRNDTRKVNTLFLVLVIILLGSAASQARNIVLPTDYGYGVAHYRGGFVQPYIAGPSPANWPPRYIGYYPYYGAYNPYYYRGYYPSYSAAPSYPYYYGSPVWNGNQWSYSPTGQAPAVAAANLNLRSSPSNDGRSNLIGGLVTGENVWIVGQAGNWYLVQSMANPSKRGYAYSRYFHSASYPYGSYSNAYYSGSYYGSSYWPYHGGYPYYYAGYYPRRW